MDIIIVSSYVPRECGIATYTHNLYSSLIKNKKENINVKIIALVEDNNKHKYKYSKEVIALIRKNNKADYKKAGDIINKKADIVLIQHEFGLYGGEDGNYVINFIEKINKSVFTYLHTIPIAKNAYNRSDRTITLKKIYKYSEKVIIPARIVLNKIKKEYKLQGDKLEIIRHGTPNVPYISQKKAKEYLGINQNHRIISSIGLMSRHKGIDLVVRALPKIIEKHKNAFYYIIGEIHPIKREVVEEYFKKTFELARTLGVEKNIVRIDKYLSKKELIKYFQVSDIYLTPYDVPEQVSSGTLAYAMACGRCIVSTPYIYARELIGDNKRGFLIDYNNPEDIARKVNYILNNPKKQKIIEEKAYEFGQSTSWDKIAKSHLELILHSN